MSTTKKHQQKNQLDPKQLLEAYKKMLLIRKFEEKCGQIYGMGLIGGFCHLYIGQEAVAAGLDYTRKPGDAVITSYRDHGHILLAGTEPKYVFAELMGRATGCSKGKGGSMHLFDLPGGFYGGHGIVGAQVPLGTGLGFAKKYQNTDNISYTYLGDGAVNQGQLFEAMNMAAIWSLPVLYVIENNEYAMGTSVSRSTKMTDLYRKGESFGVPGMQINGMDFTEVYHKGLEAVEYVRSGQGPFILEVKTYRYRGHSMSDPAKYRTKEELSEYKDKRDPIEQLKQYLLEQKISNEDEIKSINKEIKEEIANALEFAENSPEPNIEELYTEIYSEE